MSQDEVEALRRSLEREIALGRRTAEQGHRTELQLAESRANLKATRDEFNALRRRMPVRIVLGIGRRLRPIVGRARAFRRSIATGRGAGAAVDSRLLVDDETERGFLTRLQSQVTDPAPTTGPLVSIVMLNRNGAAHLRRCLPAVAAVAYRDIELVVVDNASTDDSLAVIEAFQPSFPVRVMKNAENESFSIANNRAVAGCNGELILFLNNDIEPVGTAWLDHMVATLGRTGAVAVGARLIYPRRTKDARAGLRFADLSLQHGGVGFRMEDGVPVPEPLGAGKDALSEWATAVREAPALTAACLLVRRADFDAVGGFDAGYEYGFEDVDLCLRLRARGGRLVYDGRAALWHHESSSRILEERSARQARGARNRERFIGTWAPRLYRTVMLDAVRGAAFWRTTPLRVALDDPADPDGSVDVMVTSDDARDVTRISAAPIRIAWIRGDPESWLTRPWFDDFDLVLVGDEASARRIGAVSSQRPTVLASEPLVDGRPTAAFAAVLEAWLSEPRFGFRIGPPSWDVARFWGDLHVARDLQRALGRRGVRVRIHLRSDWAGGPAARDDVSLHILGTAEAPIRPGQLNVLWHLSHPDLAGPELYRRYDLAFVASDRFAAWMAGRVDVPVAPLHQATDPERFAPSPGGTAHELLFVANSRGLRRHLLDDLLPTAHELAVYGRSWTPERLDPKYLAGEHIANDELAAAYGAAAIVLNDHWLDMQREGFMSNRLYDAAAAGAFVISDDIDGLEAEFDGGIVGYADATELRQLIDRYLADPDGRHATAARARAAVLARHTFGHRARTLLDAVEPLLAGRALAIEEVAEASGGAAQAVS